MFISKGELKKTLILFSLSDVNLFLSISYNFVDC